MERAGDAAEALVSARGFCRRRLRAGGDGLGCLYRKRLARHGDWVFEQRFGDCEGCRLSAGCGCAGVRPGLAEAWGCGGCCCAAGVFEGRLLSEGSGAVRGLGAAGLGAGHLGFEVELFLTPVLAPLEDNERCHSREGADDADCDAENERACVHKHHG